MKISKGFRNPELKILTLMDDVQIFFDKFTPDSTGVQLEFNGELVAYLYFEQATEFYKAWRAM